VYAVGVDVGSISTNCVVLDQQGEFVYEHPYQRHFGRIAPGIRAVLRAVLERFGADRIDRLAFTGNHGKMSAARLGVPYEYDSITQLLGAVHLVPHAAAIVCMGGQAAALYRLSHEDKRWHVRSFAMNGPCAAGTGSFIDQQAERLASSIYDEHVSFSQERVSKILGDFIALGQKSDSPAPVACRCTVFTKSDMIHLQNRGEPLPNIIAGLHQGNAANCIGSLAGNRDIVGPVVFVGGVASNQLQVEAMRRYYPELLVPPHHTSVGALGAALFARTIERRQRLHDSDLEALVPDEPTGFRRAPALRLRKTSFTEGGAIHGTLQPPGTGLHAYLGIDVGSTTTKTVLMDTDGNIVHKQYVQTQGRPIEVAKGLLAGIDEEFRDGLKLLGTATTGSGRYVVGDFIGADVIIDEITAHARAAVHRDPGVDTVFEIGGQDSKYIWIEHGNPLDFDMNKVCAAGTGSFLHELANKLGVNIVKEFQEIALSSSSPIGLTERCTVFMESDLLSYAQQGARLEDLLAGLCYAVVHNYLNRVVQKRRIGKRVMFLGGPSLNMGVVAAFENVLGQEILVPAHREVLGAYGAALSLLQTQPTIERRTAPRKPLASLIQATVSVSEKVCRADKECHNECKLKIYDFGGRKSVWGGECGRYEMRRGRDKAKVNWFKKRETLFAQYLKGHCVDVADLGPAGDAAPNGWDWVNGRPTVGILRGLHSLQLGVLWTRFWDNLGFAPVLSPKTTRQVAVAGIECTSSEVCYPIKVFHGHLQVLNGRTDLLFLPTVISMPTPRPDETGFYCPMVQGSQYMVRAAVDVRQDALISPTVCLNDSVDRVVADLHRTLGKQLGLRRRQIDSAFRDALQGQRDFEAELHRQGREFLDSLGPEECWIAVTGRPYNLYDERLNLHLGERLAKLGIEAIPQDFLDTAAVDLSDFPNMYWGLGAQILRTAKLVRRHSSAYGIHLTNFGCGADSFVEHFYRHVMEPRPYLILELDEHTAVAGIVTRLEAFANVIRNDHGSVLRQRERPTAEPARGIGGQFDSLRKGVGKFGLADKTFLIPEMSRAGGQLVAAALRGFGVDARVMKSYEGLSLGKEFTSGKECFPCQITLGDVLHHLRGDKERLGDAFNAGNYLYCMAEAGGPCRFGMYTKLQRIILDSMDEFREMRIAAITAEDGYAVGGLLRPELRSRFRKVGYLATVAGDVLDRMRWRVRPYERSPGQADAYFDQAIVTLAGVFEHHARNNTFREVLDALGDMALQARDLIDPTISPKPLIGLVGEIYLRSHQSSNQDIILLLERHGAEVVNASIAEWLNYVTHRLLRSAARDVAYAVRRRDPALCSRQLRAWLLHWTHLGYQYYRLRQAYRRVVKHLAIHEDHRIGRIEKRLGGDRIFSFRIGTEAPLSIGGALEYAAAGFDGVVNIFPFTCMPSTMCSAILKPMLDGLQLPYMDSVYDGTVQPNREAIVRTFMYQAAQHQQRRLTGGVRPDYGVNQP
jgi:predicted CoA-substrate-specific enzyme activase